VLVDDRAFQSMLRPFRIQLRPQGGLSNPPQRREAAIRPMQKVSLAVVAVVTVPLSAFMFEGSVGVDLPGGWFLGPIAAVVEPFRSVNSYGLFAVMTTTRPEIVLEGSDDGRVWQAYEFKYKPTDIGRRPRWVAPHQPRVDWQLWFAALGRYEAEPWFQSLCLRLLQASPATLRLLERDPFGGRAPRYVRATLFRYRFSDFRMHSETGAWWTRERVGEYSPVLTLGSEVGGR
jgi:hypothetical protein